LEIDIEQGSVCHVRSPDFFCSCRVVLRAIQTSANDGCFIRESVPYINCTRLKGRAISEWQMIVWVFPAIIVVWNRATELRKLR
jgi:hypothetical protein